MPHSLLLIGHSHVNCVQLALRQGWDPGDTRVINIRKLPEDAELTKAIAARVAGFEPEVLCLCLGGNYHNVLGLLEHPAPFSISVGKSGRQMIPKALIRAMFQRKSHENLAPLIFDMFPNARRLMLDAPPPIADFEHIRANPGIFADQVDLGPAPADLRLALYVLQSDVTRALAREHGAELISPGPALRDQNGFLAARFTDADPTHGNAAYGREILAELHRAVPEAA